MSDRRHSNPVKDVLVPVIVAVIIGAGSTFVTLQVAISAIESDLVNVKGRVVDLSTAVTQLEVNTTMLAERGVWMRNIERRLDVIENTRFTLESAKVLKYEILEEVNRK